jgi:hypothetical protein
MGQSAYSDDAYPDPGERDPVQLRQGAAFLNVLRHTPAGAWADNRWEQVQHYNGPIYTAVRRIMSLFFGSTYRVMRRRKPRRGRTTFGPGKSVAKSVSGAMRLGRDEDYVPFEDADHPLCALIRRPNNSDTFGRLTAKGVLQYHLTGVFPLWAIPNRAGRPVELWPLRTPFLFPLYQMSRQYPCGAWRVQPYAAAGWAGMFPGGVGPAGAILPGEEVKRLMNPHPIVDYDGFSPLTAGGVQLDVLQAVDQSRKSAMDNGLQLDAVLIAPGMDEGQAARISADMTEKMGGSRNARKFLVATPPAGLGPGDKTTLETLGQSPREMDYSQGWEQMTKFALALFGVPPAIAGLTAGTSYSELYAARRQFLEQQDGLVEELAAFYTQELAGPWSSFPDEYQMQVVPKPVDDHDLREQQFKRRLEYDLLTYNEARVMDDADPVEGGDIPRSLYLKQLEAKLNPPEPEPEPAPGGGGDKAVSPGPTPTGGAVPQPANPAGEGSRPPVAKAMGEMVGSAGGFLVPPGVGTVTRKKKRRATRRYLQRVLKSL